MLNFFIQVQWRCYIQYITSIVYNVCGTLLSETEKSETETLSEFWKMENY